MRRGLRKRQMGTKVCECPKCGHKVDSQRGIPCTEQKCPKCGTTMRGQGCL
jgi:NAD-dependent SIR2 family protein deacetylase